MTALALERQGNGWRLQLEGSWSLGAMARIDDELRTLTTPIDGPLVCDWSHVETPGIGPVWALLGRLADLNSGGFPVTHIGEPHTLEFLQKLNMERRSIRGASANSRSEGMIGKLGRWTLLQGS